MSTTMHRLQICLPESQVQYLVHRSKRDGISIAELIRRFVADASQAATDERTDSLWDIAGIGEDSMPLTNGVPVSEKPDMYLADTIKKRILRPTKTTRRKPR